MLEDARSVYGPQISYSSADACWRMRGLLMGPR